MIRLFRGANMKKCTIKKMLSFAATLVLILSFAFSNVSFCEVTASAASIMPNVEVQAHVENKGWLKKVSGGATAGTTGQSLKLEDIKVRLINASGGIKISTHQANVGWVPFKSGYSGSWVESGSTGKNQAIEAVKIQLYGSIASQYDIYYRVHVPYQGWLGWARNNEISGSVGLSLRTEAIQVKLVKKGISISRGGTPQLNKPSLTYQAHVQNIGTMGKVSEGKTAGTEGQSLRIEAIWVNFKGFDGKSGISVRAHVSDIGWQNWVSSGQMAGTTGQSKQIEAVQIKLSSYMANFFDVYYRLHCADYGWLGYASNGETAGTTGGGKRAEAIQIVLVPKGSSFNKGETAYMDLSGAGYTTPSTPTVFSQTDSRWANVSYGYSNTAGTQRATLSSSGCGILSYVNAVYYLNGKFIDPATLASWSVNNGYRVNGVGTSGGLYRAFANTQGANYGFKYTTTSTSYSILRTRLQNGEVAIGGAPGHLMAIVNYNPSNGKFLILDSYKSSNRGTYSTGYTWKTESECRNNSKLNFSNFYFIAKR